MKLPAGKINSRVKHFFRPGKIQLILLSCFILPVLAFIILNLVFPLKVQPDYSVIITSSDGKVIHAFLNNHEKWRMKTELSEITPALKTAIINKEDKYFYHHPGINPFAMMRALFNNIIERRKTSGASTITMQVARMMQPKERTVISKLIEIFRAFQLEWYYSKDEILQLYLNMVPYGSNIEGVKSASVIYFQQSPSHLSLAQIVTLAIIPNRPSSLGPGKNNEKIKTERNKWLEVFKRRNLFDAHTIADAESEPVEMTRHEVPRLIPHFALRLRQAFPTQAIIHTYIKSTIQQKTEQLCYNYIQRIKQRGIHNACVVVVDNQTKSIVAYLGSADMSDDENQGMVDGIKAIRSPGSTLKPFLYALAIDKGLITPKTVVADVAVNFSGYQPKNYDDKFRGNVTIEYSLANSLNIPAIKTLNDVGVKDFTAKLKQAGFKDLAKNENNLGLSVILGGCGVRLEELAGLFSSFATSGKYSPLHWAKEDTTHYEAQLCTPSSSFIITDILSGLSRPDLPVQYQDNVHLPKIAWKTGTSYGHRDAWSIGYNKHYTIGVWVGNFVGTGVPELSGAEIATPLLFDLFNSIDYNSANEWFAAPAEIGIRYVCSESGLPANDFCTNEVLDYYIQGISPNQKCQHAKYVSVSPDEKISYCPACQPENGYVRKLYPNLSPEVIAFYEAGNIPYKKIPEHNPLCKRVFYTNAPRISSPSDGIEYILEKKENQQIALSCQAENEVKKVYWYINDRFYKSAGANEKIFFIPPAGQVKVSCADDRGRNSDALITVTYIN